MRKVSLFTIKEDKPPKISKFKPRRGTFTEKPQDEQKQSHPPKMPSSIYAVVAAKNATKSLKEKSQALMKEKRKRGDWGEYDLAHAWSPEDCLTEDAGSRSSRLEREMTGGSDYFITMARPCVMKPVKTFQAQRVKSIIKEILEENLEGQVYEPNFCRLVTTRMTDQLKERVKRLRYPRYKYICHAIVGDINNHDVRIVSRCAWDSSVDSFAKYEYQNFTLYAVALVYGVYCE